MTDKNPGRAKGSRNRGYSVYAQKRGGKPTGKFNVQWQNGTSKRHWKRGILSKAVAVEIGRAKAAEADRVRGGVISADESSLKAHGDMAIKKHIDAWRDAMKHRGCNEHHYRPQHARVVHLCGRERAGIRCLVEITAEKVQRALAVVAANTSPQTARHYFGAMRSFVRWCIETRRLERSPLIGCKLPKAHGETFRRTVIAPDKLADLINATIAAGERGNATGKRRALFYAVLAYTGVRKGEARSLTRESFNLEAGELTVEASYSKHRRRDVIPLPRQFVDLCGEWIRAVPTGRRLFPYGRSWHIERALRMDCADCGIKPAEGERLGVHSLRRLYITSAIRGGGLAVAQDLARHSTPQLTKKYSDLTLKDYGKALDALPEVKATIKRKKRSA